jgi:hypothetical protein
MPVELRNIKGGGLHYVAYPFLYIVISLQLKPNSSEPVSSTTVQTKKDLSRVQDSHPIMISMMLSIMKEYK